MEKPFICLNKYNYERDNDEKYLLKSRIREKLFMKKNDMSIIIAQVY